MKQKTVNKIFTRALTYFPSKAAMAMAFGVTRSAITKWELEGIPVRRSKQAELLTRGVVTRDEVEDGKFY